MKTILLLLTCLSTYNMVCQTVYRLTKTELYDWENNEWLLTEDETYTYSNTRSNNETLLVNRTLINNMFETYRRLKQYSASDHLTLDTKQLLIDNNWIDEERDLITYNNDNRIIQELHQEHDDSDWINEEKFDYEYPNPQTTITKEYQFENNTWVQYTQETLSTSATMWTQETWSRNDQGAIVPKDRLETMFVNDKLDEQISKIWNETNQSWENDGRYKVHYNSEGLKEKEEIFDWDTTATPASWALNVQIIYEWSNNNTQLIETYEDCETADCIPISRRLITYNNDNQILSNTSEMHDSENDPEWIPYRESIYTYDSNKNNTIITTNAANFFNPNDVGLEPSYEIRNYWEEGVALSVDFKTTRDFNVYPNPTTEVMHIAFKNPISTNYKLKIFSTYGQLIKQLNVNQGLSKITISLEAEKSGIYFVHLDSGKKQNQVFKIIKH